MSTPTIHIETNPISRGEYYFLQTWVVGIVNVEEREFTETHNDRMYAAMTNLGYACRWLADKNIERGSVCIVTDRDGRDTRYNAEHDDLFEAIQSQHDYERNRIKYCLIYGKYAGYLDRIRDLANANEITFTQNAQTVESGKWKVESESQDDNSPFLIKNQNWTRESILRLSMKGTANLVTCRACQKSIQYLQSDDFVPFHHWYTDIKGARRSVMITSNKHLVKNFLELHLGLYTNKKK